MEIVPITFESSLGQKFQSRIHSKPPESQP